MNRILLVLFILVPISGVAKDKTKDPRLAQVATVFVQGTNEAAVDAREMIARGKTCLRLVQRAEAADAVFDVTATVGGPGLLDTLMMGSRAGGRQVAVAVTLTLKSGDLIWSKTKRESDIPGTSGSKMALLYILGQLSKDAECRKRTTSRDGRTDAVQSAPKTPIEARPVAAVNSDSTIIIKSTPEGAEILVDGKFVGSTPSTVRMTPGDHLVVIQKTGFQSWQRSLTVSAGSTVTLDAALEKIP